MDASSYLMGESQGELDLVGRSLGVASALEGGAEGRGASPQGRAGKAEGVHGAGGGSRGEEYRC